MFQFNHIDPKKKDNDYENLIRREISTKQLDEVDKCVLLCNGCHGIVHAQDITATVRLCIKVNNRTVEQTFKGQLILDRLERTATFFTDEPILIIPYWVYIGSKKPKMMFGKEIEDGFIMSHIDNIKKTKKKMAIHSWDDKFLMRVTLQDNGDIKLEHSVHCPFITAELCGDDGEYAIWVRNGKWLTKDGEVKSNGVFTLYGIEREKEDEEKGVP
jgi:hypothetical protein